MVEIPNGEITLRDDRLNQQWTVTIQPFLLSKYLISQDLYKEISNKNPSEFKGKKRPVECVSWKDSIEFCNLLSEKSGLNPCYIIDAEKEEIKFDSKANGFRLPSEAEWEFACKAGTKEIRYGEIDSISWYKKNSNGETHDIGTKAPNKMGLYDMLGNVWEWCSDIYDETVYGSYRIFRGGGWNDEERGCLATNRRRSHPIAFKIDDLGFRIAKNID
ncbi:MAG: SUMF1/EgtB/PvdO family nonheme iron enzyme [Bacteroidales bacterium]|nr:SUMF1/EgtB/PvdO family nonheme iron enzyme [Bacteroidales bacterium]